MANSPVISRKDMREPDRFQVVANRAASWLSTRKKPAALVGGLVVVAVIAALAIMAVRTNRSEAAGRATAALLETMAAPVVATPTEGAIAKSFPTEDAKQKAIVAEADKVISSYGAGAAAGLPVLAKGDAFFALKQWDQAAAEYDRYLATARKDDSLRFGALEGLALVAEAKGDLAGSARAYERMAQDAPRFADRADLERARVLAASGNAEEAKKILTAFAESHKESTLVSQASQQLARLGAK